jgi:hypothetical protein
LADVNPVDPLVALNYILERKGRELFSSSASINNTIDTGSASQKQIKAYFKA